MRRLKMHFLLLAYCVQQEWKKMFWWIEAHNLSNQSLPRFTWKNTNAWVTVQKLCNPVKLKSPKIVYYVTTLSYEGILNDDVIKSASVLFQEIISLYVLRSNKKCSMRWDNPDSTTLANISSFDFDWNSFVIETEFGQSLDSHMMKPAMLSLQIWVGY